MPHPSEFPRRVLLTVSGLTPQIVTETVYALTQRQTPAFVPTRLVVMTTSDGASRVRLTLQSSDPAWLERLCKEYGLPPIAFDAADLRVLAARGGPPLPDIRTGDDNVAAADAITEAVRELTSDRDCALHVSLAGGRKTLGFFAAYALSLYGREQDRLSHVLVSPEFESNPDFYYPTRGSRVIYKRDGTPLDTKDAEIELAEIPFVRMRDGLSDALRGGRATYSQAVDAVQARLRPPELTIDLPNGCVRASGQTIKLRPVSLALYTWIAREARAGRRVARTSKEVPVRDMAHAHAFRAEYGKLVNLTEHPTINKTLMNGLQSSYFDQQRSKLNRELSNGLLDIAGPYLVQEFGKPGHKEYGFTLPPAAITIIEA